MLPIISILVLPHFFDKTRSSIIVRTSRISIFTHTFFCKNVHAGSDNSDVRTSFSLCVLGPRLCQSRSSMLAPTELDSRVSEQVPPLAPRVVSHASLPRTSSLVRLRARLRRPEPFRSDRPRTHGLTLLQFALQFARFLNSLSSSLSLLLLIAHRLIHFVNSLFTRLIPRIFDSLPSCLAAFCSTDETS